MKPRFILFLFAFFIAILSVNAQTGNKELQVIPDNPGKSVLFGKDILINDQASQNQRDVAICSAFNGWMYAAVTTNPGGHAGYAIYKSIDNGITWEILSDVPFLGIDRRLHNLDILACGTSTSDITVFLSYIIRDTLDLYYNSINVDRVNGISGIWESTIFSEYENNIKCHDVKISSDYLSPTTGSNPYSIGILFSDYNVFIDSVIFCSSNDGGLTINNRKGISGSTSRFHGQVSLAYGKSPSMNTGRFFAAWEDKDDPHSPTGHIYTSHTEPGISGSFTTPVCLDCGDDLLDNKCSNPSIACQNNTMDNDSANITSCILFKKQTTEGNNDIVGFYNLKAATTSSFHKMDIAITSHNEIQPNITFNHFDNSFYTTYYDSTSKKLPCLSKNFNFVNPDSWIVVSTGYNDSTNIAVPLPKVILNEDKQQPAYVWNAERLNGNGIAMFDAEYSTYTIISQNNDAEIANHFVVYPNPCNTKATIGFELMQKENVTITLSNMYGQVLDLITNKEYSKGIYQISYNVGQLLPGTYICSFANERYRTSRKIIVIH